MVGDQSRPHAHRLDRSHERRRLLERRRRRGRDTAGVVYTVAPSYVDIKRIWAGSDDGLIHTTADGGLHWTDVTPPELRDRPWSKVSIIDAGRFDAKTAYAAVNTIRLDDMRPHIYPHARRRQDVDADHERHSRRRDR